MNEHQFQEFLSRALRDDVIDEQQKRRLASYYPEREHTTSEASEDDSDPEAPRFIRGLHDILISFGIILCCFGLGLMLGGLASVIVVPAGFLFARVVAGKKKYSLPSITLCTLSILFAIAGIDMISDDYNPDSRYSEGLPIILFGLSTVLIGLLYFKAFRLPFALFAIACGTILLSIGAILVVFADPSAFVINLLILALGLLIFYVAVQKDFSDRFRLTGRSDQAFWLHLTAAPLLTAGTMGLIVNSDSIGIIFMEITASDAPFIVFVFAAMSFIALALDRRAIMFASTSYVIASLIALIEANGADILNTDNRAIYGGISLVIFGMGIIIIALGWQRFRRFVLSLLPEPLVNRLPSPYSSNNGAQTDFA